MLQKTLSTAVLDWIFEEQTLKWRFVSRELLGTTPVRERGKQDWAVGKLICDAGAAEASADPMGVLELPALSRLS